MSRFRRPAAPAVLLVFGLAASACSGGDEASSTTTGPLHDEPTVSPTAPTISGEMLDPPASIAEIGPAWQGLSSEAALLVAEVANGACQPIVEVDAELPAPIGPAYSLYVLGAVAGAVADGMIAWDMLVPDTDRTVEQHAAAMIDASDTMAADHLIDLVGGPAVEQAMVDMGHSEPVLNRPLPTVPDGEWYASRNDLCQAIVVLEELSRWPGLEPLDAIMAAPPGLAAASDGTMWFAGGSASGVLDATMLVDDDTQIFVSGTLGELTELEIDPAGAVQWLALVAGLLLG